MENSENLDLLKNELTAWETKNKPWLGTILGIVMLAIFGIKIPHTAYAIIPLLLLAIALPFIAHWLLPTKIKELRKKIKQLESQKFDRDNVV
jgi:hypothetical protein